MKKVFSLILIVTSLMCLTAGCGKTPTTGSVEQPKENKTNNQGQVEMDESNSLESSVVNAPFVADAPPMIYVNDALYKQSVKQTSYTELKEEFVYLGEIESTVSNDQSITDGLPHMNFQANSNIVGSKVYQYGENIVVEINGKYWLYEPFENDNP